MTDYADTEADYEQEAPAAQSQASGSLADQLTAGLTGLGQLRDGVLEARSALSAAKNEAASRLDEFKERESSEVARAREAAEAAIEEVRRRVMPEVEAAQQRFDESVAAAKEQTEEYLADAKSALTEAEAQYGDYRKQLVSGAKLFRDDTLVANGFPRSASSLS